MACENKVWGITRDSAAKEKKKSALRKNQATIISWQSFPFIKSCGAAHKHEGVKGATCSSLHHHPQRLLPARAFRQ